MVVRAQDGRDRTYYTSQVIYLIILYFLNNSVTLYVIVSINLFLTLLFWFELQTQRPPSAPSKNDYPPPAHNSRVNTSKPSEKLTVPGNHVNVFGYPAYQPTAFFPHEPKNKNDHHKTPPTSGLIVAKSNERDREVLPNPPPLMSELKNSVIVKHDGKNSHLLEPRVSQSPKLRVQDMMSHYVVPTSTPTHKSNLYEYRSPTQSPHHLASPHHHLEAQNLGKVTHHRTVPSPHHQRQSPHPHAQQHPSPELRYRSNSETQAMIFPSSGKSNYPYIASTASIAHYSASIGTVSNTKPKVSSPAPHHIYGKPPVVTRALEAVSTPNPIPLTSKPPLTASVSPSPYQQVSHYNAPHPQATPMTNCLPPPPAHTNRTSSTLGPGMYDRLYAGGSVSVKPSVQLGTSPPSAQSAPSTGVARSQHSQYTVQTQPLDLGVSSNKYDSAMSPKRKGTPVSSPVCLEKRRKLDSPSGQPLYASQQQQPQLARVSEPSPLIASAATTITTVVNTAAYTPPGALINTQVEALPDVSVTPVTTIPVEAVRPPSAEENQITTVATTAITPSPTPTPTNSVATNDSPATPAKSVTPGVMDSEKSNSPGPTKSATYPVRHLKKAWLQRHTGEDLEDTTGVTGSGSCVTLPLNINTPPPAKETPITSLHSIGSMAVNSINKSKHLTAKTNNRKGNHKNSSSINGHQTDLTKGDDSSSSDQERGRKSPPKRKPPKVKRKKGGGPTKKITDEQKRRKVVGNQSVAASESGSESDKESGSEKDSDSGASTTLTSSTKKNNTASVNSKEPRKRGRRPKTSKNDKGEEPRPKKSKEESPLPQRDPFRKPPVGQLKKTGESFLQDGPCFEVAPKLGKCRECRWTPNQRTKNMPNIFCRFYAFRRLRYTKNGQLAIAGFSDPNKDALEVCFLKKNSSYFFSNNLIYRTI